MKLNKQIGEKCGGHRANECSLRGISKVYVDLGTIQFLVVYFLLRNWLLLMCAAYHHSTCRKNMACLRLWAFIIQG